MGDLLRPDPARWQRRDVQPDALAGDAVLELADRLLKCICEGVEPDIVVLAALRIVQKAAITTHQRTAGEATTKELLRQASELAGQYDILGVPHDDST